MNYRVFLIVVVLLIPACQSGSDERVFDDPEEYVQIGNQYLRARNLNAAAKQFKYALDLDKNHYEALIGLGDALMYRAKALAEAQRNEQDSSTAEEDAGESENADPPSRGNRGSTPGDSSISPEKQIRKDLNRARNVYIRARKQREESAVPYYKLGRMLYMFRDRYSEGISKARQLLQKALQRTSKSKNPFLRAKILYYLGNTVLYIVEQDPPETRDYSQVVSYFDRYLDIFDNQNTEAPRRAEVERLLMQIEDFQEEQNESSSDS